MKSKLPLLMLIMALYSLPILAQNTVPGKKVENPGNVPIKIFRVLGVNIVIDSSVRHPSNGVDVFISETFTYVGTGVVNYTTYHTTQGPATGPGIVTDTANKTLALNGSGTEVVHIKNGAFRNIHTLKIITDTPNQVTSNVITY